MSYSFRVGAAGDKGKWERIGWDAIIEYAKSQNVEIVYIDLTKSIEEQGKFDIIIHKLTHVVNDDPMNSSEYKMVYDYCKKHPETKLIDDLDAMQVVNDRESLTKALQTVSWPEGINVHEPQSQMLFANDLESIKKVTNNLRFPLLAKPKLGGSKESAHLMRLVTNPEALVGVAVPCLLQEYINHGAVVYKVYALGDHLEVTARTSSRDIKPNENFVLNFQSQKSSEENGLWDHTVDLKHVKIPYDKFMQCSAALRRDLNLHLIGFDILIDKEGNFWIVDVNYFPGYKMIEKLEEKFFNFLVDVHNGKQ